MGATLKLDPDNAVKSLAVRVEQIKQAEAYIRATYARYAGLKSFEQKLEKLGIAEIVAAIVKE